MDLNEDLKSVQSKWCSESPVGGVGQQQLRPFFTPQIHARRRPRVHGHRILLPILHAMNDSLHDLQSDIQRLTQQQGQIQQMMTTTTNSPALGGKQGNNMPVSPNPMDPQPFYISQPEGNQARRTWGQPQPINILTTHGEETEGAGGSRIIPLTCITPWAADTTAHRALAMILIPCAEISGAELQQPMYNNVQQPYDGPQYGGGGNMMHHPNHAPHHPQYPPYPPMQQQHPPYYDQAYSSPPYNPPPQQSNPSNNPNNLGNQITPPPGSYNMSPSRTPFRLHETSPSTPSRTGTTPGTKVTVNNNSSAGRPDSSSSPRRVIHSSIPALAKTTWRHRLPDEVDEPSPLGDPIAEVRVGDNKLSERLSNLNISSGSKTYRVKANAELYL
ncbi:Uncharacterized protein FKW44_021008 [Caligus rogercresseyi]|uniref:Uncharacterized protein n=1 Tax=Caligus rogercresseyi TaxID=217165 RepID=A0A7T8GQJ8_CALRO|nr:Uncharacterized protein FKW44_021008 [Caligus rogercresseyi]